MTYHAETRIDDCHGSIFCGELACYRSTECEIARRLLQSLRDRVEAWVV